MENSQQFITEVLIAFVSLLTAALLGIAYSRILRSAKKIVSSLGRLTKPRRVLKVKAQLIAIKGEGVKAGEQYDLYGTTALGRSKRYADFVFQAKADPEQSSISRKHCTIQEEDGIYYLRDEDSQWNTYHNGKKLAPLEPVELHDGDIIELAKVERGGIQFRFVSLDQENSHDEESPTGLAEAEHPGDDMSETAKRRITKTHRGNEE
jgi:hypothetical protein